MRVNEVVIIIGRETERCAEAVRPLVGTATFFFLPPSPKSMDRGRLTDPDLVFHSSPSMIKHLRCIPRSRVLRLARTV